MDEAQGTKVQNLIGFRSTKQEGSKCKGPELVLNIRFVECSKDIWLG